MNFNNKIIHTKDLIINFLLSFLLLFIVFFLPIILAITLYIYKDETKISNKEFIPIGTSPKEYFLHKLFNN